VNPGRNADPSELTPRDAVKRYLNRRAADATDSSLGTWHYRLKLWCEWCEGVGIETVGELTGYDLDQYYGVRAGELAGATLEGEMWTLKMLIRFLEDIGAVEDGLAESVRIPDLDQDERTDDTKLSTGAAQALLAEYRGNPSLYGSRQHVLFELAWITGARRGGIRALDIRDFYPDQAFVEFLHRPDTDTPLKNKRGGERPVALPDPTVDAIDTYVGTNRYDVTDDSGRQPLIASRQGRPELNTITGWVYVATQPCIHSDCPHGRQPQDCEYRHHHHGSKCPSSRSPHQLRTGVVTYLLNQGWPPEDVAERVNSQPSTIEQHYDKADIAERRARLRDRMEDRRRHLIENMEFTT
jgi:site-specific recombinase XerD